MSDEIAIDIYDHEPEFDDELIDCINECYDDWRELPELFAEAAAYVPLAPDHLTARRASQAMAGTTTWTACDGDDLAGAISFSWDQEGGALLHWLGVLPEYRRAGLAGILLEDAVAELAEHEVQELRTERWIDSRLVEATGFLERHRFTVVNPDRMNVTFVRPLADYRPAAPHLPDDYAMRHFRPGDESVWTDLKNRIFASSSTADFFVDNYGGRPGFDPTAWRFVTHGGKPVGIAGADLYFADDGGAELRGAVIEWVGVLEEHRGRGLARSLMVSLLNYTHERGLPAVSLITQYFRAPAVALYESLGFRMAREHRIYARTLN